MKRTSEDVTFWRLRKNAHVVAAVMRAIYDRPRGHRAAGSQATPSFEGCGFASARARAYDDNRRHLVWQGTAGASSRAGPFDGSWTGESGGRPGRIWDVSLSGRFIDAFNDQRSGEPVTVSIDFPEGRVSASGVVVYSIPNQGCALRFTEVQPESHRVLFAALGRLLGAAARTDS